MTMMAAIIMWCGALLAYAMVVIGFLLVGLLIIAVCNWWKEEAGSELK